MVLIATKDFNYAGKALKAGDRFDPASNEDARLLKGWDKAQDDPEADTAAAEAGTEGDVAGKGLFAEGERPSEQPTKSKRQYRRRDMVAED